MKSKIIDFKKYSSIKIGPKVEVKIIEKDDSFLEGHYLIGKANNLLVSNNPPPLMMLGSDFDFIEISQDGLIVGCAVKTGRLLSFAKKNDIANLEFIAKLPGSVGGMLAMNAGVKSYEIFNIVKEIEINGKWIKKRDIEYGYRFAKLNGFATKVKLELKKGYNEELKNSLLALRANQPKEPSAGSCFKNPKGDYAGRLIEAVGLKGYRVGDMAFSQVHANFLVNLGDGKFEDAKKLIDLAKSRVFNEFGINLEEELKII